MQPASDSRFDPEQRNNNGRNIPMTATLNESTSQLRRRTTEKIVPAKNTTPGPESLVPMTAGKPARQRRSRRLPCWMWPGNLSHGVIGD